MKRFLFLGLVFSLLLTACGGAGTPEPVTYQVDMTEFAYAPAELQAQVGQPVTIELTNSGNLVHELMIGRNVVMEDNRPAGYEQDMFESAGVEPEVTGGMDESMEMEGEEHMHEGFMVAVPEGGNQATITFTPTEDMVGEWEIGCFEQDGVHYDAGMKGTFTVTR